MVEKFVTLADVLISNIPDVRPQALALGKIMEMEVGDKSLEGVGIKPAVRKK
jgi:hypothetical protein